MWRTVASNDLRANVIIIDLLGFGESPVSSWAKYDAHTQARAVAHTLLMRGITRPVVVVGHSMGALVGVELAKKHQKRVESMILCSPPFYRQDSEQTKIITSESLLKKLYLAIRSNPVGFAKLTSFATKYRLVNPGFNVTAENIAPYVAALEGMILNQTSFDDALKLKVPTYIIRGNLDPFVISGNLKVLKQENPNISVTTIAAGHEVRGLFLKAINRKLEDILGNKKSLPTDNGRDITKI